MTSPADAAGRIPDGASGFDVRPSRPLPITLLLCAVVILAASTFAHLFRDTSQHVIEWYADVKDPTRAAADLDHIILFVIVTSSVIVAATIGGFVNRRWADHVGVEAVGASARGEGRRISLRATGLRALATWTVSSGMVSIGRESAIIETGGAVGSVIGRKSGGRGDAMATAGIAAAFAAAYHAPLAAAVYVEEHLGVRSSKRAIAFALSGSILGHLVSVELLGGGRIFPPIQGSQWRMIEFALIGLIPAVVVARLFLEVRVRVSGGTLARRLGVPRWAGVGILAVIAGAMVTWFPSAAGNGMEALRHASTGATVTLAVGLVVGKFVGTTASLGAGAPGGVLTPTITIASGSALLTLLAVQGMGLAVTHPWDAMVAAMAVGVAVGLRSPFMAAVLLPEMLGDYTLVPAIAGIVAVAVLADRGIDYLVRRFGEQVPTGVHDEDA